MQLKKINIYTYGQSITGIFSSNKAVGHCWTLNPSSYSYSSNGFGNATQKPLKIKIYTVKQRCKMKKFGTLAARCVLSSFQYLEYSVIFFLSFCCCFSQIARPLKSYLFYLSHINFVTFLI